MRSSMRRRCKQGRQNPERTNRESVRRDHRPSLVTGGAAINVIERRSRRRVRGNCTTNEGRALTILKKVLHRFPGNAARSAVIIKNGATAGGTDFTDLNRFDGSLLGRSSTPSAMNTKNLFNDLGMLGGCGPWVCSNKEADSLRAASCVLRSDPKNPWNP